MSTDAFTRLQERKIHFSGTIFVLRRVVLAKFMEGDGGLDSDTLGGTGP